MGTDPAPGKRGAAAGAMVNFQLEDFVAGWIGGERSPGREGWRDPPEVSVDGDSRAGQEESEAAGAALAESPRGA